MMSINPYQAPTLETPTADSRTQAAHKIKGPSTGLILLLSLQILGYVIGAFVTVAGIFFGLPSDTSLIEIGLALAHFAVMLFMLWALLQIRQLRHLRAGRIAAGLACIPMVAPWIWVGIPFGIWLSIFLARPSTVEAFATHLHDGG